MFQELAANEDVGISQICDKEWEVDSAFVDRHREDKSRSNWSTSLTVVASGDDWLRESEE